MIILSDKPGQLGNLLFLYANFLAYGFEHQIKISNPSFCNFLKYFESTQKRSTVLAKLNYTLAFYTSKILHKTKIKIPFISVTCLLWDESCNLDIPSNIFNKGGLRLVQGWLYRAPDLLLKHKQQIIDYFKPTQELTKKIDDFFKNTFAPTTEIIIGIHIRRGDYENFQGGKYYYSLDKYSTIVNVVSDLFQNKKIHFLICSNEPIDLNKINKGNHNMSKAPNHELMDMYCLSRCNYIIGPPSTYSMWASFYGSVPLYQVSEPNRKISLIDFNII
ncbi:alpha-1,2-fucosyltransferase [Aurantibacillus circumpalustris]|uniref:alpha-1,2-fucosyltransferase n=1 Tax=Aurantibacillus circumpalustris TaxID=3036359 RepID=UPI00295C01AC|nr:alpha-1,2-fucosyltransferase [Aurantibacillus circumpalustris]